MKQYEIIVETRNKQSYLGPDLSLDEAKREITRITQQASGGFVRLVDIGDDCFVRADEINAIYIHEVGA